MLPEPAVDRRMRRLIRQHDIETVWFGAAAPLAPLASGRGSGARRVLASTHGHEVGWSMPGARSALCAASVTARTSSPMSAATPAVGSPPRSVRAPGWNICRRAWTSAVSHPIRQHALSCAPAISWGDRPVVVCISRLVPRKGGTCSSGRYRTSGAGWTARRWSSSEAGRIQKNCAGWPRTTGGVRRGVHRRVPAAELPAHYAMADVFAMPCRTRGAGLDVEGLGIVFLEASATGVAVVAGDSGGAPETVRDGETGRVVDGRSHEGDRLPDRRVAGRPRGGRAMGEAGRRWSPGLGLGHHTARLADLVRVPSAGM